MLYVSMFALIAFFNLLRNVLFSLGNIVWSEYKVDASVSFPTLLMHYSN